MPLPVFPRRPPAEALLRALWRSPWRHLLRPASALFEAIVRTRGQMYARGLLRGSVAGVPTFSVGGLEAGGSGKTPVVAWLLRELQRQGRHPGLLTRGYGRRSRGLVVRAAGAPADPATLGDEAAMLAASGLDVPMAAAADRRLGARALCSGHACDALVLDDGFSHRALQRHLDLVVLRAHAPLGNGQLQPAGPLREPPDSLRRAQVIWLMHKGEGAPPAAPAWLAELCPEALMVSSSLTAAGVYDTAGVGWDLRGQAVVAVAGIALPESFLAMLRAAGAQVVEFVRLADHQRYSPNLANRLRRRAQQSDAWLVTTAKDAVKLAPLLPPGQSLRVLHVALQLHRGQAELIRLLRRTCSP